jgi:hypothetical protein
MTTPPHLRANPVLGSALDLRRSQIRTYERVMREHGDAGAVPRRAVPAPGDGGGPRACIESHFAALRL